MCKYLHKDIKNKTLDSDKSGTEKNDNKEVTPSVKSRCSERNIEVQMIEDLELAIASKNSTIQDLTESVENLKTENKNIKEQVEKLMRIAGNMHKELKELKSKSC